MSTISWKDIIESNEAEVNESGFPEDMYVDPAESTPDFPPVEYRIYEVDNYFKVIRSDDNKTFKVLFAGGAQLSGGKYTRNAVDSISITDNKYYITITSRKIQ